MLKLLLQQTKEECQLFFILKCDFIGTRIVFTVKFFV